MRLRCGCVAAFLFLAGAGVATSAELKAEPYFAKVTADDLPADAPSAVVVTSLDPEGLAARAGLREGDRVLALDGFRVYGCWEEAYIAQFKRTPAPQTEFIVRRRGKIVSLKLEGPPTQHLAGYETGDDCIAWSKLLQELRIPCDLSTGYVLSQQSPRLRLELQAWLAADPANHRQVKWLEQFVALRMALANQQWAEAKPVTETIPLPLAQRMAALYAAVAKQNADGEKIPAPEALGVEEDFLAFSYPLPRYVPPPLGKLDSTDAAFKRLVQDVLLNPSSTATPEEAKPDTEKNEVEQSFANYVEKLRFSVLAPMNHGGWPVRFNSDQYSAADPGARIKLVAELEKRKALHDADETIYSYALAQLYAMQAKRENIYNELNALYAQSPLLAFRASVNVHGTLEYSRLGPKDFEKLNDWRREHQGPLAPREPTLLKFIVDRISTTDAYPDLFDREPGDKNAFYYPGHLRRALRQKRPLVENVRELDAILAAGYDKGTLAPRHRELLARMDETRPAEVLFMDYERFCLLGRDRHDGGLMLDAFLDMMEHTTIKPGQQGNQCNAIGNFMKHVLGERPNEPELGSAVVYRTLAKIDWSQKEAVFPPLQKLYEEHGRLVGTAEIAAALRAHGHNEEAAKYERRLQRAAALMGPALGNWRLAGYQYIELPAMLSSSPVMAEEAERLLRVHQDAAQNTYSGRATLLQARALMNMNRINDAVECVVVSFKRVKFYHDVFSCYSFDGKNTLSDDEYRRWLVEKLAAHKDFTAENRAALLASPAGKDEAVAKLLAAPPTK